MILTKTSSSLCKKSIYLIMAHDASNYSAVNEENERDFNGSVKQIFLKLNEISKNIPTTELKLIGDKYNILEENQKIIKSEISRIKTMILDPEDGVIVKLNRAVELSEKQESFKSEVLTEQLQVIKQLESWKETVTKVIWILFATILGLIFNIILKR